MLDDARARHTGMSDADKQSLVNNIVAGLPGANDSWTLEDVRAQLATYGQIDADRLRQNLIDFLSEVVPTAEEVGIRLCCHPDDPPFSLLGLPRVMSTTDDYATVLDAIDSPANGATLCTGSLGVRDDFDPVDFVQKLGPKIHFVHLRNTRRTEPSAGLKSSFYESEHLGGDTDMVATIGALLAEQKRRQGRRPRRLADPHAPRPRPGDAGRSVAQLHAGLPADRPHARLGGAAGDHAGVGVSGLWDKTDTLTIQVSVSSLPIGCRSSIDAVVALLRRLSA
jgi:mannonate dehydratase